MLFRSNDTATTEIYTRPYTLSLPDALPIYVRHIVADPANAADVLGFRAAVDWSDGLADFAFAPLRG